MQLAHAATHCGCVCVSGGRLLGGSPASVCDCAFVSARHFPDNDRVSPLCLKTGFYWQSLRRLTGGSKRAF